MRSAETTRFYEGRRVLVTGHTGFKGTWLCVLLERLGAEVYGYSLAPEEKSLYLAAKPVMTGEIFGDVRDGAGLRKALAEFEPEVVVHLAAHSFINGSYEFPEKIFDTNVQGTVRLLEAMRELEEAPAAVVVTSDKCYARSADNKPFDEDSALGAAEAYSASKACQDIAAQSYQFAFPEMKVGVARANNVLGGGDLHSERLIPHLLECFLNGVPARLRNPDFVRPWQYVLDALWGYLTLGKMLVEGQVGRNAIFNFGPGEDGFRTVRETAEMLAEFFPDAVIEFDAAAGKSETAVLRLDSSRAKKALGWEPAYSFREALERTADFAKRARVEDVKKICQAQVDEFVSRVSGGAS